MKKYLSYKDQIIGLKEVEETIRVAEEAAASHIHFLKKQVEVLSRYKENAKKILTRLSGFEQNMDHPLLEKKQSGKKILLVVGGNKGIVGGLYHNLVNFFLENKNNYEEVWVLGNKTKEYLEEEGIKTKQFPYTPDDLSEIEKLSNNFFSAFKDGTVRSIDILYSEFVSLADQRPTFTEFLPFDLTRSEFFNQKNVKDIRDNSKIITGMPIFDPNKKSIFASLLQKYISIFFTQIVLEANLSEFSARTITAENAIYKAKDIVSNLNLAFFKERRKSVSQRQLESFVGHKNI